MAGLPRSISPCLSDDKDQYPETNNSPIELGSNTTITTYCGSRYKTQITGYCFTNIESILNNCKI